MYDSYNRRIHYLRISVTDRCNLRCGYCMPKTVRSMVPHSDILSFEEIAGITRTCVGRGVDKVRITDGEPLVRRDIAVLVSMLSTIEGILDLAMTTNGTLLDKYAAPLAHAGLQRVNVSLDTVDPARYGEITCGGDLRDVLRGIEAARDAGLDPIKLNCVVNESAGEDDARQVAAYAGENGFEVRFIRRMNREEGRFWPVEGGTGGDCRICNRLRLTCDGRIFPCLFGDLCFNVRELGTEEALDRALHGKPRSGVSCNYDGFNAIGG